MLTLDLTMRFALRNPAQVSCLTLRESPEIVSYDEFGGRFCLELRNIPTQATHETPFATTSSVTINTFNC